MSLEMTPTIYYGMPPQFFLISKYVSLQLTCSFFLHLSHYMSKFRLCVSIDVLLFQSKFLSFNC